MLSATKRFWRSSSVSTPDLTASLIRCHSCTAIAIAPIRLTNYSRKRGEYFRGAILRLYESRRHNWNRQNPFRGLGRSRFALLGRRGRPEVLEKWECPARSG